MAWLIVKGKISANMVYFLYTNGHNHYYLRFEYNIICFFQIDYNNIFKFLLHSDFKTFAYMQSVKMEMSRDRKYPKWKLSCNHLIEHIAYKAIRKARQ